MFMVLLQPPNRLIGKTAEKIKEKMEEMPTEKETSENERKGGYPESGLSFQRFNDST